MSLDNNYTYVIMVSITSTLLNAKNNTFLNFHIFYGNDVEKTNLIKISSLRKINFNSNFKFYNVGNNFKGWISGRKRITQAAFYRLIIAELIPNLNKIIYLDGDTLIYNDLREMYNLKMNNLFFRGIHEIPPYYHAKKYKLNKSKYICDGIMLMNLKLIRKEKVFKKSKEFYINQFNNKIIYPDQDIINYLFMNKIGFLPPKYGIWFLSSGFIQQFLKEIPLVYNKSYLIQANNEPVIRHLWGTTKDGILYEKPWLFKNNYQIKKEWNYYAKKTGYYSSICSFFKYSCLNISQL